MSYSQETIDKANDWYKNGQVGLSSHTMWLWLLNKTCRECDVIHSTNHPFDWDDFKRCYLLLEAVPEFKPQLYRLKEISPIWEKLVNQWDHLTELYEDKRYNELNLEIHKIHQGEVFFKKSEFTKPRGYKSVASSETLNHFNNTEDNVEEKNDSLLTRLRKIFI